MCPGQFKLTPARGFQSFVYFGLQLGRHHRAAWLSGRRLRLGLPGKINISLHGGAETVNRNVFPGRLRTCANGLSVILALRDTVENRGGSVSHGGRPANAL